MIVIGGFVLGAGWGAFLARRRKGRGVDIAQYAGVYGIIFALLGVFITVILARMV